LSEKPILYGYSPSTYVRTVRMVLADNHVDYDQVSLNVLGGETRLPEHLARHPFGKVPVLDMDGMRLRETYPICRYVDETRDGPSVIPGDAKGRAKMAEAISLYVSYGYGALLGLAAYHLFPDFIGGKNDGLRASQYEDAKKLLGLLMEHADPWIVGKQPTLADYFLGPVVFYVAMTPDADQVLALPGVGRWWEAMQAHETFKATEPDLG
jgi:glutathione S-transferase